MGRSLQNELTDHVLAPGPIAKAAMGIAVVVLTISGFYPFSQVPLAFALITWVAWALGVFAFIAYRVVRRRRQFHLNTRAATIVESEPFTLYLRPFRTSGRLPVLCQLPKTTDRWLMGKTWDLEFALTIAVDDVAPLVAIGHQSASLGAAKVTASDETWRETMLDLARRAQHIVMVPLDRPSTLWEAEQVLAEPALKAKTLFLMPPRSLFRGLLERAMPWRSLRRLWNGARAKLGGGLVLPAYDRRGAIFDIVDGAPRRRPLNDLHIPFFRQVLAGAAVGPADDAEARKAAKKARRASTLFSGVIGLLLALAFRSFVLQPFSIPSGSMRPTLLEGDYLFVAKWAYGYSQHSGPLIPAIEGRTWGGAPQRGDVVVFKFPPNPSQDFIKRLIGLPGDRIQMREGVLFIDGTAVPREKLGQIADPDVTEMDRPVDVYRETLPNGVSYEVLDIVQGSMGDDTHEFEVPPGHYFMLGDNRDNSSDSRFNVGFVPADHLVGRAMFFFFSIGGGASPLEIWKWPGLMRPGRIFQPVR